MKKLISIVVILLLFCYSYSQAQVNSLIKNSPFHFFDGTFNLSYEKSLANKKSINLSGGFHLVENGWNDQKHASLDKYKSYFKAPSIEYIFKSIPS